MRAGRGRGDTASADHNEEMSALFESVQKAIASSTAAKDSEDKNFILFLCATAQLIANTSKAEAPDTVTPLYNYKQMIIDGLKSIQTILPYIFDPISLVTLAASGSFGEGAPVSFVFRPSSLVSIFCFMQK